MKILESNMVGGNVSTSNPGFLEEHEWRAIVLFQMYPSLPSSAIRLFVESHSGSANFENIQNKALLALLSPNL